MIAQSKTPPQIKGFNPTTFIDWEGRIASIIFLAGCNFRCPYCHSSDLVLNPEKLPDIPLAEVKAYLKEKRDWIEGLVVTGGEPTIYESLPEFLSGFKKLSVPIKLDTNGSRPEMLERLLKDSLLDYIALDIKAPLENSLSRGIESCLKVHGSCLSQLDSVPVIPECSQPADRLSGKPSLYEIVAGVSVDLNKIKRSMELIMSAGIDYEFRTTVAPGQLKNDDIVSIARGISGARRYILQQFIPRTTLNPEMMKLPITPVKKLEEMARLARTYVPHTSLRSR